MNINLIPTICPYCGCGCGLNLVNVNGKIKGVEPWKRNPINEGKLCPKGNFSYEFVNHEERLKTPLIKENGQFREASWDETLNEIVRRLQTIRDEDPDLIAFLSSARCTNEDNYVLQKFARAVIGTNNIDNCAALCHGPTVSGLNLTFGSGAMTNSIGDIEKANCIFIIGSNPLEQHPLIGRRILKARANGAKIIVADPRYTPTAKHADLFLPLIPGTDVALINSIMHVILRDGLEDQDFIKKRTMDFEKLKNIVKNYSPDSVEHIIGVPAADIEKTALTYGESEKSSIIYCLGITEHIMGMDNVMSLANLTMLTGNIGREGTGLNPLRGQNNVQGVCDMGALPFLYPGYKKYVLDSVRADTECEWDCDPLNFLPGLQMVEILEAAYDGRMKAMYIMGENPVFSEPETLKVKESLMNLETLIVQDIFLTETAAIADFVLPATSWAEKNGTFTNTERRVQRVRKAADPPGLAMEDWRIFCQIARVMGSSKLFTYQSEEDIFHEIRRNTPQYAGITYQRLEADGLQWPCPDVEHPGTPILHGEKFATSHGLGVFKPIELRGLPETPDDDYPLILSTGRIIFHYHNSNMTGKSKILDNEISNSFVELNPYDALKLDLSTQETVKIKTRHGEIETKVKITSKIAPGIIFLPIHFLDGKPNLLTNSKVLDPSTKMPELKALPARIEKI
ncbi:MAG: formate dehydrogenase subunit alpha [Methanobacterium sp.]|nr:formate dehydrogenase subunit alpha [Methanobacterium sp.]